MTVIELSEWLASHGIPEEFCQKFEGEFEQNVFQSFQV